MITQLPKTVGEVQSFIGQEIGNAKLGPLEEILRRILFGEGNDINWERVQKLIEIKYPELKGKRKKVHIGRSPFHAGRMLCGLLEQVFATTDKKATCKTCLRLWKTEGHGKL